MKLKKFIEKLKEFDQDLPVCLDDWSEQYAGPNESVAETMEVWEGRYGDKNHKYVTGRCLLIG